ncbi:MAG: hypothetical protein V2I51_18735 [Anderseniella sp.]|nr:hypothetical protein [Anderseniella sp.]
MGKWPRCKKELSAEFLQRPETRRRSSHARQVIPVTPIEASNRLATVGKQAHIDVLLALLNQDSVRSSKHLAVGEEF